MKKWQNKFWCLLWNLQVMNKSKKIKLEGKDFYTLLKPLPAEINAQIIELFGLPKFTIKQVIDSNPANTAFCFLATRTS